MSEIDLKEECQKIIDFLSDEKHWTQGTFARNAEGAAVSAGSNSAVSFCMLGIFNKFKAFRLESAFRAYVRKNYNNQTLVLWNDNHSYRQVTYALKAFKETL